MLRKYDAGRVGARIFMAGLLATTTFATATMVSAQTAAQNFSIPAQSLDGAMAAFSRATRIQVLTRGATTQGVRSPGVQGTLPPQQALTSILSGTGLVAQFAGGNTVTLVDPTQGMASGGVPAGDAIVLEPINVAGSGAGAAPADVPYETAGSSSYISAEQIDRLPGSTAGDIFKSTPGVIAASNHNGGASVDVNIRGLQGQNRVKVAIDGTQQSTTTWRGYAGVDDRTYIDPDLIGGVVIEKGPTSSAAGAGVTGGVVAIRTLNAKDIVEDGKDYGARLRVGTSDNATNDIRVNAFDQSTDRPGLFDFENGTGSAAVAARQENFDFVAAFGRRKSGNYFVGTKGETQYTYGNNSHADLSFTKPGEEAFNTSEDSLSALAKGTIYWGDEHSLELGYTHFESEFGEAIGSLLVAQDTTWRQVNLAEAETNTFTARYRWKPLDNDLYDLRANVWRSDIDATTRSVGPAFYFPPFLTPEMRPPADDPRLNETTTWGTDITNTSRVDTSFGLLKADYGASYVLEDMYGHAYQSRIYQDDVGVPMHPSIGTREIASVFSRGEWEINDWLTVSSGLRYDAYRIDEKGEVHDGRAYADKEGGRLNPSTSVTVSPFDGVQLYGLYAEGVRPPSLRETVGSDSLLKPNPDLEPEIAKNWEFGVNYLEDGVFEDGDKLRMKLAYFHNNYEDYIARVSAPLGSREYYMAVNLDTAMFKGFEFSGSYDAGVLFAEAAVTYYTGFEFCPVDKPCMSGALDNDYAMNHIPPDLMTSVTLGARLFDQRLTFGVRVTHAGERLSPLGPFRKYTGIWVPYTVADAFASYRISDNVTVDLKGENLTDRYYVDALDGWMPAPGRTIRASLTAKF